MAATAEKIEAQKRPVKKCILLVDEDIELLKKFGNLLVETYPEYEIIATDDLATAIKDVEEAVPTIIIVSLEMNGNDKDAIEWIKELRKDDETKTTPIVGLGTRSTLERLSADSSKHHIENVPKSIRIPYFMGVVNGCMRVANSIESVPHKLAPGDVLFKEGDESNSIFYLKSGTLNASQESSGKEILLGEIQKGQLVGEQAFLSGQPRSATITAATECILVELKLGSVDEFLREQPFWMKMMLENLIERLIEANKKIKKLSTDD